MEKFEAGQYDVIVVGAGHAGCEAALACARLGHSALMLTMNPDSLALMACNPAIGGTSKGHLVREIDALGGEMGLAADDTFIQMKLLNTAKGPAVHSSRAQMDKRRYHERMKRAVEDCPNLYLRQGEAVDILTEGGAACGVLTSTGGIYRAKAVILACGVYLESRIIIGEGSFAQGPCGMLRSEGLSDSLTRLGFNLRRFKTGTPARVHRDSLDLSVMEPQDGDDPALPFSFAHGRIGSAERPQEQCYLTYTNEDTHKLIRDNLHRAPMYTGKISGTGARYCPSIEDKVVRFADKPRHQLFLEPEGLTTKEMYVQGMSTSLPEDVQLAFMRTIAGLERVQIIRSAYAIEYDCIDSTELKLTLESRVLKSLYFAGQINGSSGYEEAAAQGLMAGLNAALALLGKQPVIIDRSEGYIGVLIDDLVTKGTNEPYRMMTSRAEYRLTLRQDNADLRLSEIGYKAGLLSKARYDAVIQKKQDIERELARAKRTYLPIAAQLLALQDNGLELTKHGASVYDMLKRPDMSLESILRYDDVLAALNPEVLEQLAIQARYEGYIAKQAAQIEKFKDLEDMRLGEIDYTKVSGLRIEAAQKLQARQPLSIGQASRISGVSPADVSVLMIHLERERRRG